MFYCSTTYSGYFKNELFGLKNALVRFITQIDEQTTHKKVDILRHLVTSQTHNSINYLFK